MSTSSLPTLSGLPRSRQAPSTTSRGVRVSVLPLVQGTQKSKHRRSLAALREARLSRPSTYDPHSSKHNLELSSQVVGLAALHNRQTKALPETDLEEARALDFVSQQYAGHATSHEQAAWASDLGVEDTDTVEDHEAGAWVNEEEPALETVLREFRGKSTRYSPGSGVHGARLANRIARWEAEMPGLVQAFLRWRHDPHVDELPGDQAKPQGHPLHVVDWHGSTIKWFHATRFGENLLCHLVERGYMPCSPDEPKWAISLHVMEVLHHARVRAYVSHESFARILCDLHGFPYRRHLRVQLSRAYDVWLEISLSIERRVKTAFRQDSPDWRLRNSCPACEYRLEGEDPLPHSKLISGDGNNSSKRFAGAGHQDTRKFSSDYILDPDEVDEFARGPQGCHSDLETRKPQASRAPEEQDTDCTVRWTTTTAQREVKHWRDALHACGNFLVSCRHAFVLLSADMIESGELAKYSLACLNRLLRVHGSGLAMGYDIGCDHAKTIERSSLGETARKSGLRMFVGAFHGYAHNRKCQLDYHPRFVATAGLEDFETNEWIFSKQNLTAPLFRHASEYHRHATLHCFWARWDEDRRAGLGDWLLGKYKQALAIVEHDGRAVLTLQQQLGLSDDDFRGFLRDEREYFHSLRVEPEGDGLAFKYLETLKSLRDVRSRLHDLGYDGFVTMTPEAWSSLPALTRQRTLERDYLALVNSEQRLEGLASQYELALDTERWVPDGEPWKDTENALACRAYNRALDELESLVVQRLFEMEKRNLRGTGYKLRTAIAKALKQRSLAIQSALARYNKLARELARPTLSFQDVLDYSFLSDFALLRYSRNDILEKPWATPKIRQATVKWLLVQCAREEIKRLDIEIRRVWSAVHLETPALQPAIQAAEQLGDMLFACELSKRLQKQARVDARLRERLQQVSRLPGFSGTLAVGRRSTPEKDIMGEELGCADHLSASAVLSLDKEERDEDELLDDEALDDDELVQVEQLAQVFAEMDTK